MIGTVSFTICITSAYFDSKILLVLSSTLTGLQQLHQSRSGCLVVSVAHSTEQRGQALALAVELGAGRQQLMPQQWGHVL